MVVTCSYGDAFDRLYSTAERHASADAERRSERAPLSFVSDPTALRGRDRFRKTGPQKLALLFRTLDSFGYKRGKVQRMLHREFVCATLPQIMGEDMNANRDELLRQVNRKRFQSDVLACPPRRFGKTTATCMFV